MAMSSPTPGPSHRFRITPSGHRSSPAPSPSRLGSPAIFERKRFRSQSVISFSRLRQSYPESQEDIRRARETAERALEQRRTDEKREESILRLQKSWQDVIDRYSNIALEDDDEIDLQTGQVLRDAGKLRAMEFRDDSNPWFNDGSDGDDSESVEEAGENSEDELGGWGAESGLDPQTEEEHVAAEAAFHSRLDQEQRLARERHSSYDDDLLRDFERAEAARRELVGEESDTGDEALPSLIGYSVHPSESEGSDTTDASNDDEWDSETGVVSIPARKWGTRISVGRDDLFSGQESGIEDDELLDNSDDEATRVSSPPVQAQTSLARLPLPAQRYPSQQSSVQSTTPSIAAPKNRPSYLARTWDSSDADSSTPGPSRLPAGPAQRPSSSISRHRTEPPRPRPRPQLQPPSVPTIADLFTPPPEDMLTSPTPALSFDTRSTSQSSRNDNGQFVSSSIDKQKVHDSGHRPSSSKSSAITTRQPYVEPTESELEIDRALLDRRRYYPEVHYRSHSSVLRICSLCSRASGERFRRRMFCRGCISWKHCSFADEVNSSEDDADVEEEAHLVRERNGPRSQARLINKSKGKEREQSHSHAQPHSQPRASTGLRAQSQAAGYSALSALFPRSALAFGQGDIGQGFSVDGVTPVDELEDRAALYRAMIQVSTEDLDRRRYYTSLLLTPDGTKNRQCRLCRMAGEDRQDRSWYCRGRISFRSCTFYQEESGEAGESMEHEAPSQTPATSLAAIRSSLQGVNRSRSEPAVQFSSPYQPRPVDAKSGQSSKPSNVALAVVGQVEVQTESVTLTQRSISPATPDRASQDDSPYYPTLHTLFHGGIRKCKACREAGGERARKAEYCKGRTGRVGSCHFSSSGEKSRQLASEPTVKTRVIARGRKRAATAAAVPLSSRPPIAHVKPARPKDVIVLIPQRRAPRPVKLTNGLTPSPRRRTESVAGSGTASLSKPTPVASASPVSHLRTLGPTAWQSGHRTPASSLPPSSPPVSSSSIRYSGPMSSSPLSSTFQPSSPHVYSRTIAALRQSTYSFSRPTPPSSGGHRSSSAFTDSSPSLHPLRSSLRRPSETPDLDSSRSTKRLRFSLVPMSPVHHSSSPLAHRQVLQSEPSASKHVPEPAAGSEPESEDELLLGGNDDDDAPPKEKVGTPSSLSRINDTGIRSALSSTPHDRALSVRAADVGYDLGPPLSGRLPSSMLAALAPIITSTSASTSAGHQIHHHLGVGVGVGDGVGRASSIAGRPTLGFATHQQYSLPTPPPSHGSTSSSGSRATGTGRASQPPTSSGLMLPPPVPGKHRPITPTSQSSAEPEPEPEPELELGTPAPVQDKDIIFTIKSRSRSRSRSVSVATATVKHEIGKIPSTTPRKKSRGDRTLERIAKTVGDDAGLEWGMDEDAGEVSKLWREGSVVRYL